MAKFKASKLRVKRALPYGEGKPIIPNVGIAKEYESHFKPLAEKMAKDYQKEFENIFDTPQSEEFFAMDASISSIFKSVLKRLDMKWGKIFNLAAVELFTSNLERGKNRGWCEKAAEAAQKAALFSLSTAGIEAPKATYSEYARNVIKGAIDYNTTLIKNIQKEEHEKVYNAVMLSLTSPNPEEQGMPGIVKALTGMRDMTENRIHKIAIDQTSKMYGAMAVDRMKANKVEYFRWEHVFGGGGGSRRGRIAWRESHRKMDGEIFRVDDPKLWDAAAYPEFDRKKGDIGIPGYAIWCHCRMRPIVLFTDADIEAIEKRYGREAALEAAA